MHCTWIDNDNNHAYYDLEKDKDIYDVNVMYGREEYYEAGKNTQIKDTTIEINEIRISIYSLIITRYKVNSLLINLHYHCIVWVCKMLLFVSSLVSSH